MIRVAPCIADERALGPVSLERLLRENGASELADATVLRSSGGVEVVRFALPAAHGVRGEPAVSPVASGRARLTRYTEVGLRELLRARFTAPRSESLAEREWNLLCHLRASGLSTPEPLAVGRDDARLFARRSFLVTRELSGMRTLASWRSERMDVRAAAHVACAVGEFMARIFRSGTHVPALSADRIAVAVPRTLTASGQECGDVPAGARFAKLPEVALLDCHGGCIVRELGWDARVDMLADLGASLPAAGDRFFLRIVHTALARGVRDAATRRRLVRRLSACEARPHTPSAARD